MKTRFWKRYLVVASYLVTFLAALLILGYLGYHNYRAEVNRTIGRTVERELLIVRQTINSLETYFSQLAISLHRMALAACKTGRSQPFSLEKCLSQNWLILKNSGVKTIWGIDTEGELIALAGTQFSESDIGFLMTPSFKSRVSVQLPGEILFSRLRFDIPDSPPLLLMGTPFSNVQKGNNPPPSEKRAGALVFVLDWQWIVNRFFAPVLFGEAGYLFACDEKGLEIYSPNPALMGTNTGEMIRKSGNQDLIAGMKRFLGGEEGYFIYPWETSPNGKPNLQMAAFSPLQFGNLQWGVAMTVPYQVIIQGALKNLESTIFLVVTALFFALLGILLAVTTYRRSIVREERLAGLEKEQTLMDKVKEAHDLYRTLLESISEAIAIVDNKGKIHVVTPRFQTIFGLNEGNNFWAVLDDKTSSLLVDIMAQRRITNTEISLPVKGGDNCFFMVCVAPLDLPSIRGGYLFSALDIHDRKLFELGLEEANRRLRHLDELKSNFLATTSHELRTPLSVIIGYLSLITGGELTDEKEFDSAIEVCLTRALHLERLIKDLLDLSRIEKGMIDLSIAPIDLIEIVRGIAQQFEFKLEKKQLKLKLDLPNTKIMVAGDRGKIDQIFDNLVDNAVKFSPPEGEITISLLDRKNEVECAVADQGEGIPPEQLEMIFDRFYQVDSSAARKVTGTGIGLAIVKELVELHGGRAWAESAGDGSSIHFTLPKKRVKMKPATTSKTEPPLISDEVPPETAGKQILICEDDQEMGDFLQYLLNQTLGCEVAIAHNGTECLKHLKSSRPDLLLLDIMLPDINGHKILATIRDNPKLADLPVIVITAAGQEYHREQALQVGVSAFLVKPIDNRELVDLVIGVFSPKSGDQ